MLTSTFRRPRCAAVCRGAEHRIDERDRALGPLDAEPLLTHVFRAEERLERFSSVETTEDVTLLVRLDVRVRPLQLLLHPALLHRILDVHVLDADRSTVCVAQHPQKVAQSHLRRAADHRIDSRGAAGEELAVEVPDRQPVGCRVELGVHLRLFDLQRVEVGDEVAADPVHVDQLVDLGLLL